MQISGQKQAKMETEIQKKKKKKYYKYLILNTPA